MTTFPAILDAAARQKKADDSFSEHIREAFSEHILKPPPKSRAWYVGKTKEWCYAFRVVWLPGNLHFSGDLGELSLTHYHALPSWRAAVEWINQSDFHYLMEKSDAKEEFNQEKTAIEMVRMAEDYYDSCDEPDFWRKIFEYLDGCPIIVPGIGGVDYFEADERNVENEDDRALAAKILIEDVHRDLTPETVYHTFQIPDFSGIYNYPPGARWQYEGLKLWARLVMDTDEYKQPENEQNVEAVS